MAMLKKILAPTDFSVLSGEGVRYACLLANEVGAQVIVLNVVVLDETNTVADGEIDAHKVQLTEFVAKALPHHAADVKRREVVLAGQPYSTIVDCAENERIDLIVMSSHGRSGLSRMLIGSVTDRLLRAAKCPVMVVPSLGKH
ncbi:MAG TPA: universal stress protein [Candidatus Limnocylindria bacterium]|nr:universal stress protein [Candidatus Limnocylindria bacterium]